MSNKTQVEEYDAIVEVVNNYIEGARQGSGAVMKRGFHDDATIFGYVGDSLFGPEIQKLYDWNDQNGKATGVQSRFTRVDVEGTAASVRLDTDNWTGFRFTDFFNLAKVDSKWTIVSKVFYVHPN